MDIMNNMTVSTSKLTFSLIAITALLISGSAFLNQEADAAISFTAYHNSTTNTQLVFNEAVNGTLVIADWKFNPLGNSLNSTLITITDIQNDTHVGTGIQVAHSNFINNTVNLSFTHTAIPTDATYFLNFTGNLNSAYGGYIVQKDARENAGLALVVGVDAEGDDRIPPVASSAKIMKSNPSRVEITMSETVGNVNSTAAAFTITSLGGNNNAIYASDLQSDNGTSVVYVTLQNPAAYDDILTISYSGVGYLTDAINSNAYNDAAGSAGVGNRLVAAGLNDLTIVNWIERGMYGGDISSCFDCNAPTVTDVKISLDSSIPIKVTNDNQVHINAGIDDTVSVMVTVADNLGADTIPFAGIYTNFGNTPDNLYYSNNFDSAKQMSTSYYEWNVRNDDVAFDNDGAITWTDATSKVNPDRTQTFTYTMTINDAIESSQVWVDIGDKAGNYAKLALPITLEVSGAPGLTFASDDTQKVVSFFNESILLAIVSQWTATSSDDASNVEQLSSVLGIESQLPTWTTELASWVADDKIDVADMIVAVEYVINL